MNFISRPLQSNDLAQAAALDRQWFGEHGILEAELSTYITHFPDNSLTLMAGGQFAGFTTFEIIQNSNPREYVGIVPQIGKLLFIHQFTTTTNYQIIDSQMDEALLEAVEAKAKELGCVAVWEALAADHPYSRAKNPDFDAFEFYESHGYTLDPTQQLTWQPNPQTNVLCYLFSKSLINL